MCLSLLILMVTLAVANTEIQYKALSRRLSTSTTFLEQFCCEADSLPEVSVFLRYFVTPPTLRVIENGVPQDRSTVVNMWMAIHDVNNTMVGFGALKNNTLSKGFSVRKQLSCLDIHAKSNGSYTDNVYVRYEATVHWGN